MAQKSARSASRAPLRKSKVKPDGGGVASVDRALAIVDALKHNRQPMTLAELAKAVDLYKSTLLRLTASLERFGYVVREPDGKYWLGLELVQLGQIANRGIEAAETINEGLGQLTSDSAETAAYFVRSGDQRMCLFRKSSPRSVRYWMAIGDVMELGRGSAGRILVAFKDGWSPELTDELIVRTFGERDPDLASMSCPVFGDGDRLLGAISVAGPIERYTREAMDRTEPQLRAEASRMSLRLGAGPDCVAAFIA